MILEGVAKRWSRRRPWILRDIDLDLPPGSMTVLAGANGSGKSTLLRVAAGLTPPTHGRIRDRPERVAVVPDNFRPPTRMSAASYLNQLGRMRGLTRAESARRTIEIAERLLLAPGLHTAVEELSKGNTQKVLLAQAFLGPVDLLVLDEPGTALDAAGQVALDELVEEARVRGAAVLQSDPARSGALEIIDGRLRRPAHRFGRVVVELVAADTGCDAAHLSSAIAGCAVERVTVDRLRVTVDAADSDTLLAAALRDGWSVRALRPLEIES